ncbi:MAG: GDP-mannose 4,6-dehydratase [Elusimicrobia bacterium]|nr:GDP-mannose 4,6-dehydratase [Elusimicrobiota bacterium]
MAEKAVVLGSNSFSGSHFVDLLLNEGLEVLGISRSPEPHAAFLPYRRNPRLAAFRFLQLDLNRDLDRLLVETDAFRPEYLVNFSALGMVAQSWQAPAQWFETNALAMVRLHEALRKRSYLKKVVHASTPEVYGCTSGRITEDAPYNPSTPYAVSKAACDMILLAFARNYGYPAVLTRSANVYGPGQQLYRVVPRCVMAVLTGRPLDLQGGGESRRSFIHIRDVAAAMLAAARRSPAGAIYHLGTETEVTIRGLVEAVCRRMGADFAAVVKPAPARAGQDGAYLLDCGRARAELAWRPRLSLEEGLDETIAWARENLSDLKGQPLDYVHKP